MDTIVYLLVFLVVVTISIYIYNVYRDTTIEQFQSVGTPANTYIESDLFPNLTPSTYIEIPYYSTIKGIQDSFVQYVTNYKNFRGDRDRFNNATKYTYVAGNTDEGYVHDILVGVELENNERTIGYRSGDIYRRGDSSAETWGNDNQAGLCLFYSGGFLNFTPESEGWRTTSVVDLDNTKADTRFSGNIKLENNPSSEKFTTNFNIFKRIVGSNYDNLSRSFLRTLPYYNINNLRVKVQSTNYSQYNLTIGVGSGGKKSFWTPRAKFIWSGASHDYKSYDGCPYNIGEFVGGGDYIGFNLADIDRGALEKLRVHIYGSLTTVQSNDFKESAFYGSLFNFANANIMDMYLRVPYYSSNFNGADLMYSHGLFGNDVQPRSELLFYLYDPDNAIINNNDELSAFLNTRQNTLRFPPSSDSRFFIHGNPNGGSPVPISNLDIKQQFIGKISREVHAKMTPMLRRYITSWSYNRTLRILQRRLETLDTNQKFYFLMGLALNNYFYYKDINDMPTANKWKTLLFTGGMTDHPDDAFSPERDGGINDNAIWGAGRDGTLGVGMGYGLVYAYFNVPSANTITYSINDRNTYMYGPHNNDQMFYDDTPGRQPYTHRSRNLWLYKSVPPTITPELVNALYSLFISCVQKLEPNYGIPLNVLDPNVLNKVAQHFYELSDGLHEIVNFNDVLRVGSNMLDIRFDKKHRLDNVTYLSLRNRYIPQIQEYNRLLTIYEDGTWVKTFSNIDDYSSRLSTARGDLDPIFNPIYPVGGLFNYEMFKQRLIRNDAVMASLAEQLEEKVNTVQSATLISNTNISSIINSPASANVVLDITTLQNQYNSTIEASYQISNLINGIETNVARVFFTLDSSNFNINGIALGINAALSYNRIYNGNIDVPLEGQGNANYQPTIRYTKNIKISIDCGNVNFMKKTANMFRDTVFTDISNIVLSNIPYNSNDGVVVVDKIIGFTQIDSNTCGYTWTETQYDDFTNQPKRRNTVNIRLPFTTDDSEYQNSQLIFNNNPTIMNYSSNVYPFGNLNSWIDLFGSNTRVNLMTDIENNIRIISNIDLRLSLLAERSNIKFDFVNSEGWALYSNVTHIVYPPGTVTRKYGVGRDGRFPVLPSEFRRFRILDAITGVETNINTSLIQTFSNKTFFQIYDAPIFVNGGFHYQITPPYLAPHESWYLDLATGLMRQRVNLEANPKFPVGRYRLRNDIDSEFDDAYMRYERFTGEMPRPDTRVNAYLFKMFDLNTLYKFVEDTRYEYFYKELEKSDRLSMIDKLRNEVSNLPTYLNSLKNSQNISPEIQNYITNNFITIPRYLSDIDNRLGDVDGACPALRCENPLVMTQLMEQYNNDSNNPDRILSILNSYTVNEYQCDYKVITINHQDKIPILTLKKQIQTDIDALDKNINSSNLYLEELYSIANSNDNIERRNWEAALVNYNNVMNNTLVQMSEEETQRNPEVIAASNQTTTAQNPYNEKLSILTIQIRMAIETTQVNPFFNAAFSNEPFPPNTTIYSLFIGGSSSWANNILSALNINSTIFRNNSGYNSPYLVGIFRTLIDPNNYVYSDTNPTQRVSVYSRFNSLINYLTEHDREKDNYDRIQANYISIRTRVYNDNLTRLSTSPIVIEAQNRRELAFRRSQAALATLRERRTTNNEILNSMNQQKTILQNRYNSVNLSNSQTQIKTKSFEVGVDIRDCSYYFGEASNTGYFISENQNPLTVVTNKPGSLGFNYITTTFNSFSNEILNLINPLIDEANKQSSNMFTSIYNQRVDTYNSVGALNSINFSNAPPLNYSNLLYLFQNNKRFFNSFFNLASSEYIESIKGFGITNSNTLQLLVNQKVNNTYNDYQIQIIGPPTTVCLEYGINVTNNYLDYTPYFIKNVSLDVTKDDIFNFSKALPFTFNTGNQINNNIPIIYVGNSNIRGYIRSTSFPYDNSSTYANIMALRNTEIPPLDTSNINDGLLSRGYNQSDINRYAIDTTRNIVEFELNSSELLPFNKRYFKLEIKRSDRFYEYRTVWDGSRRVTTNTLYIFGYNYRYIESKLSEIIITIIENPYDQNIINLFHTYFNNLNKISPSKPYNSVIGQVYSIKQVNKYTLQYSVSVYHTDSRNEYINTILPNETFFNNLKYFEFMVEPTGRTANLIIIEVKEIEQFTGGQTVNDFSRLTNLPSPDFYGTLRRIACFLPINKETFTNTFIKYINTTNLTLYLKNTIPLNLTSIFDISRRGSARGIDLTSVEYRDATNDFAYRVMNKSEFINNIFFQYKFEITHSMINYDTYSYSLIIKPYYRIYYKVISQVLQGIYNSSEPTIIYPGYSNIIDFLSDEHYGNVNYPNYTTLDDFRILLQFSFNNIGKNMIDTCSRNFLGIINNINVTNSVLLSNLNQSFTYNNTNYTNLNNFISLRNFNTNTNLYMESPTPRNQYILNRTDDTARAQINFGGSNTGRSGGTLTGEYITLMTPSFINGHCYLHYGRPSLTRNIAERAVGNNPEYGRRNSRNTFAYDYLISGFIQLDYPTGFGDNTSNYKEVTLIKNITSDMGYLREQGFYVHPDMIPYDILFTPYQVGDRICSIFAGSPYIILLRNIIPLTTDITQYASQNGYRLIDYTPRLPSRNDDGSINFNYEDRFAGSFTDYKPDIQKFTNYKPYLFIKFESKSPLLFNSITLYDSKKEQIKYKVKDKNSNYIIFELSEPISGYSFITNNSGTSPNSWIIKGSDGKTWEIIHEESYELEGKKLYQTPIFYLDGTTATVEQPQSFEKPDVDVKKFVRYYKQKVNSSVNPEFKKYMYSNNVYYFIFDEYDLNNNLVAKDLIVGFEVYENNIKKTILYEDEDGNNKPFDLRNSKEKIFWDSMIGLALEFQDF